jgi:hypothetical protein
VASAGRCVDGGKADGSVSCGADDELDQLATLKNVDVTATNPNNPLAPSQVKLSIPFDWKEQFVLGFGLSYAAIQEQSWKDHDRLVLRIGYNHSNNPIPKKTLSPLAPLILENHFTGGFGFRFTEKWAFDLVLSMRSRTVSRTLTRRYLLAQTPRIL